MEDIKEKLRNEIKKCKEIHSYITASFYADKLVTITKAPEDIYTLAECYYFTKQYRRAVQLLQSENLIPSDGKSLLLATTCLGEIKEWEECLELIGESEEEEDFLHNQKLPTISISKEIQAKLCVMRGKSHFELDQRNQARIQWKYALRFDPLCYEAFELLVENQMLNCQEEIELMNDMNFPPEEKIFNDLYSLKLKKYETKIAIENDFEELENNYQLKGNSYVDTHRADVYYYRNNYKKAYQITKQILEKDPYNDGYVLIIHLSSMVELKLKNELFYCAHKLVENNSTSPISWYGVACYYYCIGDYEKSRSYFSKTTSMNPHFGPGWLGFGHAFAAQGEHDQALAAYRTAFRTLPGSHLPALCIGMELIRVNNFSHAEQFVKQAASICPFDPLVWNELGVIALKTKSYERACEFFIKSIELSQTLVSESVLCNLGHSYRKLRLFDKAIRTYQRALSYQPKSSSILTALGYTHHLKGDIEIAINYYHKSLGVNPEDRFGSEMLQIALNSFITIDITAPNRKFDIHSVLSHSGKKIEVHQDEE